MALVKANDRKVRVIESNTDIEEMQAGHIIPGADPPKNDHARGGFGDRDGRNGFGTDSPNGNTSLSLNTDSEDSHAHTDGLLTSDQLSTRTAPVVAVADDEDFDEEDDLAVDDDDLDDLDITDMPDDDFDDADFDDADLDADLDDADLDEDFDEDDDL